MSGGLLVLMVLQAVVFAIWAFYAFRSVFRLRADAVAATGKPWPGPAASLRAFAGFATLPKYAQDRRRMLVLTLLLLGLSAAFGALAPGGVPR